MKKGKTIAFSIISICLTCALFAVCVFAALDSKSMLISNSFSFTPSAEAMAFDVYGECSNTVETEIEEAEWTRLGYNTKHDYLVDKKYIYQDTYDNATPENSTLNNWEIGNLTFINKETSIVYSIKITNKSYDRDLVVSITQLMQENNNVYNMVYVYNNQDDPADKVESNTLVVPKGNILTQTYVTMVIELTTSCYSNANFSRAIPNDFRLDFTLQ